MFQLVVILMSARITARFTMYRFMVIHNGQIYLQHMSYLFRVHNNVSCNFDVCKDHCKIHYVSVMVIHNEQIYLQHVSYLF